MTRDATMKYITIDNQIDISVKIGNLIGQQVDGIVSVCNQNMNQFGASSSEIVKYSEIQSKLNYWQCVYGQL